VPTLSGARSAGVGSTEDAAGVMLGVCVLDFAALDTVGSDDATPKGVYGRSRWQPLQPAAEPRQTAPAAAVIATERVRPTIPALLLGRTQSEALVNISVGSDRRRTMASVAVDSGYSALRVVASS
jgi:predicted pyridoxine 5'-phosphate oxidase superfamily flavin-nucleotide-binding protein